MKNTEMIFLDNESLWLAIEAYAAAKVSMEAAYSEDTKSLEKCRKTVERHAEKKAELQLMLGLPNA